LSNIFQKNRTKLLTVTLDLLQSGILPTYVYQVAEPLERLLRHHLSMFANALKTMAPNRRLHGRLRAAWTQKKESLVMRKNL
jgi:hypothetical protein